LKTLFAILMLLAVASMAVLPAYANFVEFKTDKTSYKKGETIVFSGKADEEHAVKMVSVKIYGPKGEFVALISGRTDFDSILVINPLDTSKGSFASNSAKQGNGIYNATIIYDAEPTYAGKSLIFDFSLDGSPVVPSAADIMNSQTTQQPTQQPPAQQPTQQPPPQQPTQQPPAQLPSQNNCQKLRTFQDFLTQQRIHNTMLTDTIMSLYSKNGLIETFPIAQFMKL
jgi:hypothetical protein